MNLEARGDLIPGPARTPQLPRWVYIDHLSLSLGFLVSKVVYGLLPPWLGKVIAVGGGSASRLSLS